MALRIKTLSGLIRDITTAERDEIRASLNITSGGTTPAPAFTANPVLSGTAQEGQTLSCTTGTASNATSYARQWRRNGTNVSGQTGATYLLGSADVGTVITCQVTATGVTSPAAVATSNASATVIAAGGGVVTPTITTQPQSQTVTDGQSVTVSVVASAGSGGGSLSYQWQVASAGGSFTDQSGATLASYTSGALNTGMDGRQYRVIVTNSTGGTVTSSVATITVQAAGGGNVYSHVADFSGVTANTELIAFTPQTGGMYTKQTGASSGDITGQALITTTGYCRGPATAGAVSLAYSPGTEATPGSGGVLGYAKFHIFSNTSAQSIALFLRNTNTSGSSGSGANGLHGKWQGGRFGIVKRIGTTETELNGQDVPSIVVGDDVEMEFRVAAGVQKLYYRMVGSSTWILVAQATEPDSGFTPGNDVGIRFGSSSTWGAADTGPRLRGLSFGTCPVV